MQFSPRLIWKCIGEIILIGDLFKIKFNTLQYYYTMASTCSNRFLWRSKTLVLRPQTNLTFFPWLLNSLIEIFINILDLENRTNRNQEFSQWISRKGRGPQRNLVDVSPTNVISPICFHLNRMGNGNDDISSEKHFENSKTSRGSYLRTSNICILSRDMWKIWESIATHVTCAF